MTEPRNAERAAGQTEPDELDELVEWLVDIQALQSCFGTYLLHHPNDPEFRNAFSLAKRIRGHMVSRLADYRARVAIVEDEDGRHWYKYRMTRAGSCRRCSLPPEADVHRKCFLCGDPRHASKDHRQAAAV